MSTVVAQDRSGSGNVWDGACKSACQHNPAVPSITCARVFARRLYALSCISIDSDPVTVLPRFGGDFSGEENMPEIASIPCSSRARSSRVIPVLLCMLLFARSHSLNVCLFTFPAHPH